MRYALETAEAAGVSVDFVLGDVLEADMEKYGGFFDVVFMEGGILHYFHDIGKFMEVMHSFLRPGGRMIASDFHPFQKVMDIMDFEQPVTDYFSTEIIRGEMAHARFYPEEIRKQFPMCEYRKYTMSEIINAVIESGFLLKRLTSIRPGPISGTRENLQSSQSGILMSKMLPAKDTDKWDKEVLYAH